jgi:hypothetical protein
LGYGQDFESSLTFVDVHIHFLGLIFTMTSATLSQTAANPKPTLQEDRNWKNVGNWHWVTKDLMAFAKDYLNQELLKVTAEKNGVKIFVTELTEVDGDCALNVRKVSNLSLIP